jgi:predicted RNA-binding Zn ribbon-like protein
MSTGQWIVSPDGVRWFFDSGSLALDFAYTGDYGQGVPEWERLHSPEDLTGWLDDRLGPLAAGAGKADFVAGLRLRAAISRVALGVADGKRLASKDIDAVNVAALAPPPTPHLEGGTTAVPRTPVSAALSAVARDAIAIFGAGAARVRRCSAQDCAMVFYDTSRPGARRWCSMRRCGNRTKVRSHRARTQEDRTQEDRTQEDRTQGEPS